MPTAARETLEMLLGHLGFVFEIQESQRDEHITLNILTRDPARLIGRDAHTLDDLQYLLNRILHGTEDGSTRVTVDVEGYRQKEQTDFLVRVRQLAGNVRRTGHPEKLPAMNSYDRRLVHHEFETDPDVTTRSEEGSGRFKHIIIVPRSAKPAATAPAPATAEGDSAQ